MTYREFIDAIYALLRSYGLSTGEAFYAVKYGGGVREAYEAGDTPQQYVERIS
jgi:hypothetical protein